MFSLYSGSYMSRKKALMTPLGKETQVGLINNNLPKNEEDKEMIQKWLKPATVKLSSRVRQIYHRGTLRDNPEIFSFYTKIWNKNPLPIERRQSLIEGAGLGIFATRLIKKGEIIGYYDGILTNLQEEDMVGGMIINIEEWFVGKYIESNTQRLVYEGCDEDWISGIPKYTQMCGGYALCGFASHHNPRGFGQLINDCSTTYPEEDKSPLSGRMLRKHNVLLACVLRNSYDPGVKPHLITRQTPYYNEREYHFTDDLVIALNDIKEGEELYDCYGKDYWNPENGIGKYLDYLNCPYINNPSITKKDNKKLKKKHNKKYKKENWLLTLKNIINDVLIRGTTTRMRADPYWKKTQWELKIKEIREIINRVYEPILIKNRG